MIPKIYFSDYFEVEHDIVDRYGALDISLICDNPAFIDPFLIFANDKYKNLHDQIIHYLIFLRDKAVDSGSNSLSPGDYQHYYKFSEVKQTWLGYSINGNSGSGLGKDFGHSLYRNLNKIFSGFGDEKITQTAHLEKLCLIEEGVGVDKISDFTINIIKLFLIEYTQGFAQKHLNPKYIRNFPIRKAFFNLSSGLWEDRRYDLPSFTTNGKRDFVLLTPQDLLTSYDTWISKGDFLSSSSIIFPAIENEELRGKLNTYFSESLLTKLDGENKVVKDYSAKSRKTAMVKTVKKFPEIVDYYIKLKEDASEDALKTHIALPEQINFQPDTLYFQQSFQKKEFGKIQSIDDCIARVDFYKRVLESNSNSLHLSDIPLQEKQLQLLFKMTTFGSLFDYNSEVNNGRGPIDFIVSMGSDDKIGLELKLASNSKLKQNLQNQGEVYKTDGNLKHVIKIIFFFTDQERQRVIDILEVLGKNEDHREIFLIDCRKKESASNVKYDLSV